MKTVIIVLLFFASCSSHVATTATFSDAQIVALVREVLKHTPEYTHYEEGYKFDWVLFTPPENDPYPAITTKIRAGLKNKYVVYDRESDLPAELISHDPNDPIGKIYVGGFQFRVEIRRLYTNKIEVTYDDFEHSMAAGNQTIRYQWLGNRWKVIWKSHLIVS